ncbi:MAG: hypothetical protein EPN91_01290 [Salinibacterium sp.]|nr:MAG: hypothetical protein EPN91_01290 [Salinibacterium sp.]
MVLDRTRRTVVTVTAAALFAVVLVGCTSGPAGPVPTYTPTGSPSATTQPTNPVLIPDGTAAENKDYFDFVNESFYATHGKSDGRSIVDNLVAAGFTKQAMEVTFDNTQVTAADSIIVSVRVDGQCLIGQFGISRYSSDIGPMLSTGSCLIGTTRPITW